MPDHISVLTNEVLQYLNLQPNENVIDGTVGNGGHAALLLEKTSPFGKLLGIDADPAQITNARQAARQFSERIILVNGSYADLREIAERVRLKPVHGILLDLGYSSWHMEQSGKGFSFLKDEALDMRYGGGELTAEKVVNEYKERELENIIQEYGEEKFSKQITRKIVQQRRIKKIGSTLELINIIASAIPTFARSKSQGLSAWEKSQVGARTFQALRIEVNGELDNLQKALPQALEILEPGGRLVVISFHSLEDRIVKNFIKSNKNIAILTKKPVTASDEEIASNPRARSAKLRAIQKA